MSRALDPSRPGARVVSRGRTVTEADVAQFAALTGDMHPQHTDAVWAAGSRFGERVAHGMLVLSYCVGLVEFDAERVVALRRVANAVFKRPVALGDTIHVESAVESVDRLDGDHSLVACDWRVLNQDGRLVARATVELVWRGQVATASEPSAAVAPPLDEDFVPIPL
ncbi:MAG TPA: MaoC/PaaZ C-terminal domain-containing protein [Thermoleophilaceae bacterium]|nr:MaoC/PaaZ C-terminal domain-containing protein [Thermoleophilaceae bacterium]